MKKTLFLALACIPLVITLSCKQKVKEPVNPFFSEYTTPFQIPPFDLIDTSHYLPAYEKGIAEQKAEIDAIVNQTEPADFENTILAFDRSGELLRKVSRVFQTINSANTNPAMQALARIIGPMVTQHDDDIWMNVPLFQRVEKVHQERQNLGLDSLQVRLVEKYYKDFIRNGAALDESGKTRLREINQRVTELQLKFRDNLLAETNTNFQLVLDNEEDLAGLPEGSVVAAAEAAKEAGMEGKWLFTLQKPSLIPFLQYADKRELREKIYRGYFMRGDNDNEFDNKEIIREIMNLRVERARLLGHNTFAEYVISNNMAEKPENVYAFLDRLMKPAQAAAKRDLTEMQSIIQREGGDFSLESWDWWYYAEKLRKEKYNLEESELKPYLKLENARDGMFAVATKLYGITFTRIPEAPVYHPEVEVFEVKEADGSHLAVLTLDYHPRPGKNVGAWCGRLRQQSYVDGKRIAPIVTITCNFTRPYGDTPSLLSWDEVTTLWHEFGHALHGFFTDGPYQRLAGHLQRDMVELPSQIMEHWAAQPEVLAEYARHYQTNEPMPQELVDRLMNSMTFNQGFVTTEYIAASVLDMDWHSMTAPTEMDVNSFEKASMDKIQLMKEILPRYRTTYFSHVMGGYAAGYYVYLWAAVLDADAFQAFVDSGDLYNQDLASRFRRYVLAGGGEGEGMDQYRKFRGQDPSDKPLLRKRGLE